MISGVGTRIRLELLLEMCEGEWIPCDRGMSYFYYCMVISKLVWEGIGLVVIMGSEAGVANVGGDDG